jgi:hypothetical protein
MKHPLRVYAIANRHGLDEEAQDRRIPHVILHSPLFDDCQYVTAYRQCCIDAAVRLVDKEPLPAIKTWSSFKLKYEDYKRRVKEEVMVESTGTAMFPFVTDAPDCDKLCFMAGEHGQQFEKF